VRYRVLALIALLTAAGVYFAVSRDEAGADARIVQAPPTATPAASAAPRSVPASGPLAVGFTLFEGRLYLVSTSDRGAAARAGEATAPTFTCSEKASAGSDFEAWLLRNNGGGGAVAQFDHDGRLLTAPRTGTPLHCALREGPE
jgi:hypothetical protein